MCFARIVTKTNIKWEDKYVLRYCLKITSFQQDNTQIPFYQAVWGPLSQIIINKRSLKKFLVFSIKLSKRVIIPFPFIYSQ